MQAIDFDGFKEKIDALRPVEGFASPVAHVGQFRDGKEAGWLSTTGVAVAGEIGRRKNVHVLDFGCWSGVTALLLAHFGGVARVTGVDINEHSIRFAKDYIAPLDTRLHFVLGTSTEIPLPSGSVDIAVINQVFCNMHRAEYEGMIAELARVLRKPGGTLLLIDSNNPNNPETVSRLKSLYAQLEAPQTGAYWRARRALVEKLAPEAPLDAFAVGTCYMNRAEVEAAVAWWRQSEEVPKSMFNPETLIPPRNLDSGAPSSPTDPQFFLDEFNRHGVKCRASLSYPVGLGMGREKLATAGSFYIVGKRRSFSWL